MKYIGIDYGTKRIGIAHAEEGGLAFPLTTIENNPSAPSQIAALLKEEHAEIVVLGESRTLSGEANPVMDDIEQFKKDVEELTTLPVHYEREFFTSALAARQFTPDGSRKANPSQEKLDASAAALILQSYLDKMKNHD